MTAFDRPLLYQLPSGEGAAEELLSTLARRLAVQQSTAVRRLTAYDTFDWRLHRAGLQLWAAAEGDALTLRLSHGDGRPARRARTAKPPAWPTELPAGALRQAVARTAGIRRLLPRVEVERRVEELAVLDEQQKTVARLRLEEASAAAPEVERADWQPLEPALRLLPVRGYRDAFATLRSLVEEELGLAAAGDDLERALAALGRRPDDYSSKLDLILDPAASAAAAMEQILHTLLATLEANEDGVRRDLDSEFLHDFRVAVRRARSALGQVKGVFPARPLERFRRQLSWLGKVTGPTRDLDVYLLKMPDYAASLPPAVARDLKPLGAFLADHQKGEQRRLVRSLDTQRYRRLRAAWHRFAAGEVAAGGDAEAPPNAERPIAEVAAERLWRAWRKVVKRGGAIGPGTPVEALHRLRIDCKKLRYLMELFRSLYGDELERLIKRLKKLQDNLGDLNDYQVQQENMTRFARQMADEDRAPVATLLAMGRLMEHLAAGLGDERQRFERRFERFATPGNRALARRLFGPLARGEGSA